MTTESAVAFCRFGTRVLIKRNTEEEGKVSEESEKNGMERYVVWL